MSHIWVIGWSKVTPVKNVDVNYEQPLTPFTLFKLFTLFTMFTLFNLLKQLTMLTPTLCMNTRFYFVCLGLTDNTRPSVMDVSPKNFRLSKSILLIDHGIAGDYRITGDHRIPWDHRIAGAGIIE